ncbi:Gga2 protein [Candida orthopsilosis Co 90-125]|uniref:Gga2 protein n=1 Tax=Candida orthopsilosis (strain 90-125) TaxID=1136231 RepID=H8X0F1_CANO9|nr:Gga2 protein [Candida orthopsilosis Co 90-125]CCG22663.1 Gga2 protein [Candida orthopsilosis Co 90-125]
MSSSYSLDKINPKLLRRIYRACRPSNDEPNLALNLEICDYVNAKKGSAPRDAAIAVVKLISQRDPQTSELALALLDNLVKNCGYPFHLQISRKEFLNELVKRFPERPTLRYSRVQRLILAQIEEWYQTICRTSKYKDDFTYIRDMHRLLANKGYVFPEVKVEDIAVLNPGDNLKSLEDIQKEEAEVHSAKLQELIRRGRPQDLQEANKLMKIMAGFKDDNVKENKKQLKDDIVRLGRKVEILGEMLQSIESSGDKIGDDSDEALLELYSSVKSSQPIISKIIDQEGEEGDEEVNNLLALNDNVNKVIQKYQLLKGGKVEEASKLNISGGAGAAADLNLIDFDDEPEDVNASKEQGYNDLLSDLSNLTFGDNTGSKLTNGNKVNPLNLYGAGGSISLGGNTTQLHQPTPTTQSSSSNFDLLSDLNSPSPQLQSNLGVNKQAQGLDPFGFDFPSTTPSNLQKQPGSRSFINTINVNQSSGSSTNLKIEVGVLQASASSFKGSVLVSNVQSQTISQVKFMLAVPKSCKLNLQPQSADSINGLTNEGITQDFTIENPQEKQLKIKWKVEYKVGNELKDDTGVTILK